MTTTCRGRLMLFELWFGFVTAPFALVLPVLSLSCSHLWGFALLFPFASLVRRGRRWFFRVLLSDMFDCNGCRSCLSLFHLFFPVPCLLSVASEFSLGFAFAFVLVLVIPVHLCAVALLSFCLPALRSLFLLVGSASTSSC